MLAVTRSEPFRAERGRHNRSPCRPSFQNLEPGAAAGKQRDDADFRSANFRDGVVHRPRELHATVSADEALHRLRISADQPPFEPCITFANLWPDGLSEPPHSLDIWMIFELAAE